MSSVLHASLFFYFQFYITLTINVSRLRLYFNKLKKKIIKIPHQFEQAEQNPCAKTLADF